MSEQLYALKIHCMGFVSNEISCFYCGERNIQYLLLHHKEYRSNSVTYNNFRNTLDGRINYYSALLREVIDTPDNFMILCFGCHGFRHGKLK